MKSPLQRLLIHGNPTALLKSALEFLWTYTLLATLSTTVFVTVTFLRVFLADTTWSSPERWGVVIVGALLAVLTHRINNKYDIP